MKITDELLELSLKKQKDFKKIPDKINNKIFRMIDDEHSKFVKEQKGSVKEKSFSFFEFRLRYAFIAAAVIFAVGIPIILLFILKPDIGIFNRNNLIVEASLIKGDLFTIKNDKKVVIKKQKIKKNVHVSTGSKSSAVISIGKNSNIKMNENTLVKVLQNDNPESNEIFSAFLINGEIDCDVKLASKDSVFSIKVVQGKFSVKGTRFKIKLTESSVKLDVDEGTVEFGDFLIIKNDYLKSENKLKMVKDDEILNLINNIRNQTVLIKSEYSFNIDNKSFNDLNLEFNDLINQYLSSNESEKLSFYSRFKNIENKSKKILYVSLQKQAEDSNENKEIKEIFLKKAGKYFDGKLNEKDTAVIFDNNKIYISSNLNKSVYCINPYNRKLAWKFSHPELIKITSPAVFYSNKVVIPTPDLIFILTYNGELENKISISQGPSYWAVSKTVDNKLFIPGFKTFFTYDGNNIDGLKNIGDINGQIYFSYSSGNIFMNCMSDKKIKIYHINEEKYLWESSKLDDRSFIKPLIVDNNIFTADISGNIYKFNYNKNSINIIKAVSGITTDLVFKHGYIYFIGNDGNFYKLNASKFNKPVKIAEVDDNPNSEKYLVKKMLIYKDDIYYASDLKGLFHYDTRNNRINFIKNNNEDLTLIGSPLLIRNKIYVLDNQGNLYYMMEN